jgi:predicted nucleotide-binding protein
MDNKITEFIERAEKLSNLAVDEPEFKAWKDDVIRFLKRKYGVGSHEATSFDEIEYYNFYGVVDVINGTWQGNKSKEKALFQKGLKTAILYLKNYESDNVIEKNENSTNKEITINNENIFIVHGRNDGIKAQIANFLLKLNIKPIILHEQINKGQTIIEKFEKHSDVKAAVVLFTDDDVGKFKNDSELEKRARQNVIFEAGYFIGKLGREYTIILLEKGLRIPSDLDGYTYFEIDEKQRWQLDVAKELKGIGFNINMNDLV